MHVGIITYRLGRNFGGIGRYSVEVVQALLELKDAPKITLLTAGACGPLEHTRNVTCVRIPYCHRYPFLVTLGNLMIPLLVKRHRLDLVHDPNGLAPFLFSLKRIPTVLTLHDVFPLTIPGNNTPLDTLVYQKWLPRIAKRLSAVVTVSEYSKNEIVRYLGVCEEKMYVAYPGVSPTFSPTDFKKIQAIKAHYGIDDKYILYVGSIEKRKNILSLIQSCMMLWRDGEERKLVLVGSPAWKSEEVMTVLASMNYSNRVIVTGYVPTAHLPALYSGADLFVFPSIYEGFGLPPLEAMACGTPVICGATTALPEVVGEAAVIADTSDPVQLKLAIHDVLSSNTLRQTLRKKGLERSRAFSWKETAFKIRSVYENVLAEWCQ